jgi:hypothetical protein
MTVWPGTIFRSARLPCDPLPVPKLAAPAVKVNASQLAADKTPAQRRILRSGERNGRTVRDP